MKEQLISFETAKLAKKSGFNINVNSYYSPNHVLCVHDEFNNVSFKNLNDHHDPIGRQGKRYLSAPTQSLLQKWLREVHNCDVNVLPYNKLHNKYYEVCVDEAVTTWSGFNTYEEALETGLQEALKLIK